MVEKQIWEINSSAYDIKYPCYILECFLGHWMSIISFFLSLMPILEITLLTLFSELLLFATQGWLLLLRPRPFNRDASFGKSAQVSWTDINLDQERLQFRRVNYIGIKITEDIEHDFILSGNWRLWLKFLAEQLTGDSEINDPRRRLLKPLQLIIRKERYWKAKLQPK